MSDLSLDEGVREQVDLLVRLGEYDDREAAIAAAVDALTEQVRTEGRLPADGKQGGASA
jgi:Arc/MetJ-type ribon-helix-helix transcriptional regulator